MAAAAFDCSDLTLSLVHHEEPADGKPGAEISGALRGHHACIFQTIALFLQRSLLRIRTNICSRDLPLDAPQPPTVEEEDEHESNGRYSHGDDEFTVHIDVRDAVQPCAQGTGRLGQASSTAGCSYGSANSPMNV